ncbi:MAG: ATP-binding protein [Vulcanimicrobiota bacterium]
MSAVTVVALLAYAGLLLPGLTKALPTDWALAAILLLLGLASEALSVALPPSGRLSFLYSYVLLGANLPRVGACWAAAMVVLCLGWRPLQSRLRPGHGAMEMVAEGLPMAASLAALGLVSDYPLAVAVLIYLGSLWWLSPRLLPAESNYEEARVVGFPLLAAVVLAGAASLATHSLVWFGPVPLLASLTCGSLMEAFRDKERAWSFGLRGLERVEELEVSLQQAGGQVDELLEERRLLADLAKTFAASKSLEQTLRSSLELVRQLLHCDTVAFFFAGPGGLVPYRWHSPLAERLESSELLDLPEPIVERAWRDQRLVMTTRDDRISPRLLEAEQMAAAVPLRRIGVLYVGKTGREAYSRRQLHLLALVAEPMIPAVAAGLRQLEVASMMEQLTHQKELLGRSHEHQRLMLSGFQAMASSADLGQTLARFEHLLGELCPAHQRGVIWLAEGEVCHAWPQPDQLLLEAARSLRAPLLSHHPESLLAAPLPIEGRGAVVLAAHEPERFTSADLNLLGATTYFAAGVVANNYLVERLARTNQELKTSQGQLVQSSKMAAVGQLAAGIAHELNSPLAAVQLALEVAREQIDDDRPARAIGQLELAGNAVDSAREIVADLLVYSRPSAPSQAPVDLADVVRKTLKVVEGPLGRRGLTPRSELAQVPQIRGRESDLCQVVTNLILNAADAASQNDAPSLLVRLSQHGDEVVLEVEDNGPGVPEELTERIFEPFFTTKPVGSGTGLGLSVTYQVVSEHGGRLDFRREHERTVFRARFSRLQ